MHLQLELYNVSVLCQQYYSYIIGQEHRTIKKGWRIDSEFKLINYVLLYEFYFCNPIFIAENTLFSIILLLFITILIKKLKNLIYC